LHLFARVLTERFFLAFLAVSLLVLFLFEHSLDACIGYHLRQLLGLAPRLHLLANLLLQIWRNIYHAAFAFRLDGKIKRYMLLSVLAATVFLAATPCHGNHGSADEFMVVQ
jgi:hypothetical protein